MPPASLTSLTAWSVPFLICAPSVALGPVIGPAMPILICAAAEPANAAAKPSARPSVVIFLIACLPSKSRGSAAGHGLSVSQFKPPSRQKSPTIRVSARRFGVPAAPGERAGADVDPAILGRHLGRPRRPEAEKAEPQADPGVDQIIVQRQ